jgi:hypothetical protein
MIARMVCTTFKPVIVGRLTSALTLCLAVSACSSGANVSALPPAAATTSATAVRTAIVFTIPGSVRTASGARRALYISPDTQSAAIAVNGQAPVSINLAANSPNCTPAAGGGRTCTAAIAAPVGTDTFSETLYSGLNATGAVLSRGQTAAKIVAGTANTVALTLDGVIASLAVVLSNATPPQGTPATIGVTVDFYDAGGAAIVGPAPFAAPIALSDSDRSGATTLSKTTLASPADAVGLTLTYTGAVLSSAAIEAQAGNVISPAAMFTPQSPAPAPVTFNDYTTFGYDNQRDVFNPNSTAITPSSIANLHLAWQAALGGGDYNTQTQPILATEIPGHQAVLFVGGGSGNVYGYDGLTGNLLWTRPLGQESYGCENNNPIYFGVGGTVAYDPGSQSLYVVGNQNAVLNGPASNSLYHLAGASGAILGQVDFAPALAGWPSLDFSHTSVTLGSNGLAYVGTGATCDISSWRGRVAAVNVASMTLANTFFPVWNGTTQPWGGGGIWGWGGVALDFSGNVLTGVGNTDNGETTHGGIVPPFRAAPEEYSGLGEAFVALSPNLSTVEQSNHPVPTSLYSGNSVDLDVQGTPAVFRPNGTACDPIAALQAKSGSLYLYDTTRIGAGPSAQYQLAPSSYSDGFLGGPAYSPASGLLYAAVTSSSESLYPPGMIAINPGCNGTPSVVWHSAFGPDSYPTGVPRSVPAASAGGVVFVGTPCSPDGNGGCNAVTPSSSKRSTAATLRKPSICCSPPAPGDGALWAIDASTGTVLNGGEPLIYTSSPLRAPPTIDGNWIFVVDTNGDMYGLTIDSSFPTVAAKRRSIDSRVLKSWESTPGT